MKQSIKGLLSSPEVSFLLIGIEWIFLVIGFVFVMSTTYLDGVPVAGSLLYFNWDCPSVTK